MRERGEREKKNKSILVVMNGWYDY
jgi:hypothetical protein